MTLEDISIPANSISTRHGPGRIFDIFIDGPEVIRWIVTDLSIYLSIYAIEPLASFS